LRLFFLAAWNSDAMVWFLLSSGIFYYVHMFRQMD
jgi:hypothetical protein